jgi:putative colanic acid biosynthesis UDP-glucose lipid carrier transferase
MKSGYSILIRPLQVIIDISIIFLIIFFVKDKDYLNTSFLSFVIIFWLLTSYFTSYYNVYRYYHILKILSLIIKQFLIFTLGYFFYFSAFREGVIVNNQFIIIISLIVSISIVKILGFHLLKKYRLSGKNYRNVIVFGEGKSAQNIVRLFSDKEDLGYRFYGFFADNESKHKRHLGSINEGLKYTFDNNIDEVYCEESSITLLQLKKIREFCSQNNIEFSLIPENKAIYSKGFTVEHYGIIPILKPKQLPFERIETHIIKRFFDLFFSSLVCLFVFSWLFPVIILIIRIESKGATIFKQKREGINGGEFICYKFRSMSTDRKVDIGHTKINDDRITKVGAFLRKTSIDEFPQFFNVLLGQMSIIGPRPHMNSHSLKFDKEVANYMKRKSVKPGITGLAQVSGYRGEIKKRSDIKNRVRLDIFYIENWSFILDLKIVFQTALNIFKGDKNAY